MNSNYVIWDSEAVDGACVLDELRGVEKVIELNKGIPRSAGFPEGAAFTMNPDFPDDMMLVDNLINTDMLIVVSENLQRFVESKNIPCVEYLPVAIIDHKGKPAGTPYFILNPVQPVDCLDLQRSKAQMHAIAKTQVNSVERLVIDESRVDPDRLVFRLKGFYRVTLVHRDLAKELDSEGFVGNRWIELSEYPAA